MTFTWYWFESKPLIEDVPIHFTVKMCHYFKSQSYKSISYLCKLTHILAGIIGVQLAEFGQVIEDMSGVVTQQTDRGGGELGVLQTQGM